MLAFFDLMRRWGVDPDPDGTLRMFAGCMAGGAEISVEDAIRLRYASNPHKLDLRWLQVTNDALDAIPGDVRNLMLTDAPITDRGIGRLLRLQGLTGVDLAGTKITDEGLQELGKLSNLEWICVNRTQVTTNGIDRLKGIRPGITVMIGAEP